MVAVLALTVATTIAPSAWGQARAIKAEVRSMKGAATYATATAAAKPIKVGMNLPPSSTIKTGPDTSVDLFLGASAGVVRIGENTTITLTKLEQAYTGADNVVDVQLNLPEGEMYFNVNKLSQASRYEIKMPNGVAGIRGTKGRCTSRPGNPTPPIVLVDGRLVFVHVPPGGEPKAYVMTAPPPVVFTPADGVKEAPADLIRGVNIELDRAGRPGPPFEPPGPPENRPPIEPPISRNNPNR
jgi:hypothetical protein